jgi:hypothetical protein
MVRGCRFLDPNRHHHLTNKNKFEKFQLYKKNNYMFSGKYSIKGWALIFRSIFFPAEMLPVFNCKKCQNPFWGVKELLL